MLWLLHSPIIYGYYHGILWWEHAGVIYKKKESVATRCDWNHQANLSSNWRDPLERIHIKKVITWQYICEKWDIQACWSFFSTQRSSESSADFTASIKWNLLKKIRLNYIEVSGMIYVLFRTMHGFWLCFIWRLYFIPSKR